MNSFVRALFVVVSLFYSLPTFAFGNDDVIKLISAGLGEDVILNAVAIANPATFDTSADGIIKLKNAGASAAVIQKVLARQAESQQKVPPPIATSGGECQLEGPESDVAAYIRASGRLVSLGFKKPGILNDMDGASMIGHLLTFGIVKAKASTLLKIDGEKASARITEREPELLDVLFPLGKSPSSFSLFRLTSGEGSRFAKMLSAEVGLLSSSGRESSDKVDLIAKKVAICSWRGAQWQQYRIKPAAPLEPGEYGFFTGAVVADFGVD